MKQEHPTVYRYKKRNYDSAPIRTYHIDGIEVIDGVKYVDIRRKVPIYFHVILLLILMAPLLKLNYDSLTKESVQIRKHTIRVPSEMYYDFETKVLDIDLTNDGSNFETISFVIEDLDGTEIVRLNGIKPGESVGSIPIEYSFKSLPSKCRIVYKTTYQDTVFKDVVMNVLVVDRVVADNELNRDF